MNTRSEALHHDIAWPAAILAVDVFAPLLRDEEKIDARDEVYQIIRAALLKFEIEQQRLQPTNN